MVPWGKHQTTPIALETQPRNAIRSVFATLGNLAASINGLASVIDVATGRLRQQVALDGDPAPILEHQPLAGAEDTSSAKGRKAKA